MSLPLAGFLLWLRYLNEFLKVEFHLSGLNLHLLTQAYLI